MRKTGQQIEKEIFQLIKRSSLAKMISGTVYRNGMRPLSSNEEDIVVSFVTGLDGQIQSGKVNVNVFIPDIDNGGEMCVKNSLRCELMEIEADNVVRTFLNPNPKFLFSLSQMIQTFEVQGGYQHMVNIPLEFKLITF